MSDGRRTLPLKMIDVHSDQCNACQHRRETAKMILQYAMKNVDEVIARDRLLDQLVEECEKCLRAQILKSE